MSLSIVNTKACTPSPALYSRITCVILTRSTVARSIHAAYIERVTSRKRENRCGSWDSLFFTAVHVAVTSSIDYSCRPHSAAHLLYMVEAKLTAIYVAVMSSY